MTTAATDSTFALAETFAGPRTGIVFEIGQMYGAWQVRYEGPDHCTHFNGCGGAATMEAARHLAAESDAFEHASAVLARIVGAMHYHAQPTRPQYEAACAELGLAPMSDAECARYRAWEHEGEPGAEVASMLSWARHQRATREAAEAVRLTPTPAPTLHAWGSRGVRYDERCEVCHKVHEVDNVTGACRAHHAA